MSGTELLWVPEVVVSYSHWATDVLLRLSSSDCYMRYVAHLYDVHRTDVHLALHQALECIQHTRSYSERTVVAVAQKPAPELVASEISI